MITSPYLIFNIVKLEKMENQPLQRCDNCLRDFPQSKIATHFGYCRRNIKKCPQCLEMFDINFKEQHDEQYHKKQLCSHCNTSFPSAEFKSHQKVCTKKPKYCEYCDLNVPVNTYPTHLKECESRTKPCTKCNIPITNKDYYIHVISCQGPKEEIKPTRNYQDYVQNQRKMNEQNSQNIQKVVSREKVVVQPSYQHKNVEKDYAPIPERKYNQQPKLISYNPPPRQEFKVEDKKDYLRQQPQPQQRIDPKRQEIRKIPNSVNPPVYTTANLKKEESKPAGRIFNQAVGSSKPTNAGLINFSGGLVNFNGDVNRKEIGTKGYSRQPIKQPVRAKQQQQVSNKDIFPKSGYTKEAQLKESKSIEKQYAKNKVDIAPIQKNIAPEPKQKVINQVKYPDHRREDQYQNQNQNPSEIYGIGVEEDHQMQMAIMQSLGKEVKGSKGSYLFENQIHNQSFIEQQRAIQAELKNKRKR